MSKPNTCVADLVQRMHDGLCKCEGWCFGAEDDYKAFVKWVEKRWGSLRNLEAFLSDE